MQTQSEKRTTDFSKVFTEEDECNPSLQVPRLIVALSAARIIYLGVFSVVVRQHIPSSKTNSSTILIKTSILYDYNQPPNSANHFHIQINIVQID